MDMELDMAQPVQVRVATLNIHFWNDSGPSGIGTLIKDNGIDIIGLQEVPKTGLWMLNELAAMLGMLYVFAESPAEVLGNVLLSKYPFTSSTCLPLRWGRRSCVKARLDVSGRALDVHTIHLTISDEEGRLQQVREAYGDQPESRDCPHVLVGDLNAVARSDYTATSWEQMATYKQSIGFPAPESALMDFVFDVLKYRDAWEEAGATFDKSMGTAPRGRFTSTVDYILLSPTLQEWKVVPNSYKIVPHMGLSDHHMVVVDLTVA